MRTAAPLPPTVLARTFGALVATLTLAGCSTPSGSAHRTDAGHEVITGSRIPVPTVAKSRHPDTPQTVSTYTAEDIRNSGYSDVNSFLRSRPEFR